MSEEFVIEAVYEGGVFRPLRKVDLPEGKRVKLVVEESTVEEGGEAGRADREMKRDLREAVEDRALGDRSTMRRRGKRRLHKGQLK